LATCFELIWRFEKKNSLKFGEFGPFFFPWKYLVKGLNKIFQVLNLGKFRCNKKTLHPQHGKRREYSVSQYSGYFVNFKFREKKKLKFFSPTFGLWFEFGSIFVTSVFLLCYRFFKTCCHLMLNPSWDANQWLNRRFLFSNVTAADKVSSASSGEFKLQIHKHFKWEMFHEVFYLNVNIFFKCEI
jgi:hypothetical protein